MINLKQFIDKNKPIIYIEIFVNLYYQRNYGQVYKIKKIIKLKK